MHLLRRAVAVTSALALAATGALAAAGPSSAAQGNRSLAKVLTSDGNHFDRKGGDFDIVTEEFSRSSRTTRTPPSAS